MIRTKRNPNQVVQCPRCKGAGRTLENSSINGRPVLTACTCEMCFGKKQLTNKAIELYYDHCAFAGMLLTD